MAWFAVYRVADGTLVSAGSSVADEIPAGLVVKQLAADPDPERHRWDPVALAYVAQAAAPARQSLMQRITAQPEIAALSTAQRTNVRSALLRVVPELADL